jgi:hypothetical protein
VGKEMVELYCAIEIYLSLTKTEEVEKQKK